MFSCCGHHKAATTQGRPRWRGPASSAVYGVGKLVRNMKWETRSGGEGGAEKGSSHIRDFLAAEHFLSTFQMCKRTKFFKGEWTLVVVPTTEHGQQRNNLGSRRASSGSSWRPHTVPWCGRWSLDMAWSPFCLVCIALH